MKFNFKEELEDKRDRWSIIQTIVLNGLFTTSKDTFDHLLTVYKEKDGILDITLKVEGIEADLQRFCDHWQSQVRRMIKEEAKNIVEGLFDFNDIYDLIEDLKDRLQTQVNMRLDEWEKELDFEASESMGMGQ